MTSNPTLFEYPYRNMKNFMRAKATFGAFVLFATMVQLRAEDIGVTWTAYTLAEPWIVKGKIVSYDPGRANDRFFSHAVYYDFKGVAWPPLGSPWNVVQLIRSEFPDGIDSNFAQHSLVRTLTRFDAMEGLIADNTSADQVIEGLAYLESDQQTQKLVRTLLDTPVVKVAGNNWSAQYMTIALRERIQLKLLKGTLKPFSIQSEVSEMISDNDSNNLDASSATAALGRKNAILLRWRKLE